MDTYCGHWALRSRAGWASPRAGQEWSLGFLAPASCDAGHAAGLLGAQFLPRGGQCHRGPLFLVTHSLPPPPISVGRGGICSPLSTRGWHSTRLCPRRWGMGPRPQLVRPTRLSDTSARASVKRDYGQPFCNPEGTACLKTKPEQGGEADRWS